MAFDFRRIRREDKRTYNSPGMSKKEFDALMLTPRKPRKPSPYTILPKLPKIHQKNLSKPKVDGRGVPICLAEIANEPKRVGDLEQIDIDRKKTHERIAKKQEEKKIAREQAKRKEALRKEKKKKEVVKYASIRRILKENIFCKRDIPTINQIKKFLKSKAKRAKEEINTITEDNVLEKWNEYYQADSI